MNLFNIILGRRKMPGEEAERLLNSGLQALKNEDLVKARHCFIQSLRKMEQQPYMLNTKISVLIELGKICVLRNNYQDALEFLLHALEIQKQKYGKWHSDIAINYIGIGRIYSIQNKHDHAKDNFKKALQIQEINLGKQHFGLVEILQLIGNELEYVGDVIHANQYYQLAENVDQHIPFSSMVE